MLRQESLADQWGVKVPKGKAGRRRRYKRDEEGKFSSTGRERRRKVVRRSMGKATARAGFSGVKAGLKVGLKEGLRAPVKVYGNLRAIPRAISGIRAGHKGKKSLKAKLRGSLTTAAFFTGAGVGAVEGFRAASSVVRSAFYAAGTVAGAGIRGARFGGRSGALKAARSILPTAIKAMPQRALGMFKGAHIRDVARFRTASRYAPKIARAAASTRGRRVLYRAARMSAKRTRTYRNFRFARSAFNAARNL